MAREDEDGFWFIVDRVKDMIVTGGFNVFPREVEDVVAEHPAVAQVCVVGTPDDKWGEAVTAVVVLRGDAARDEASVAAMTAEIQAAVKERKGSVQAPKQVVIVDVAAADRARQARQEGGAGAVLGGAARSSGALWSPDARRRETPECWVECVADLARRSTRSGGWRPPRSSRP